MSFFSLFFAFFPFTFLFFTVVTVKYMPKTAAVFAVSLLFFRLVFFI